MDELHACFLVQIVHAVGDLFGPVEQDVGRQVSTVERLAHAAAARVLHHQAQVGLLDADRLQLDDVAVVEEPEQLRFASDALQILSRVVAQRSGHLHCHLYAVHSRHQQHVPYV